MNTKLRKKAKSNFDKDFFKLMNSAAFGRAMGNVRKHKNMKFVTTERRRICVTTKLLYYKVFHMKFIKKLRKFIKLKLKKFNRKVYCSCKNR